MKEIKLFHKKSWWKDAILIISLAWNNISIGMCIHGIITDYSNSWLITFAVDIACAIFMLVWKLATWKVRYQNEQKKIKMHNL